MRAHSAISDLADINAMNQVTLQAFARDATNCAERAVAQLGAVSSGAPVDELGFVLNTIAPIALFARTDAGFTVATLRSDVITGDQLVVSRLDPPCHATPLWGAADWQRGGLGQSLWSIMVIDPELCSRLPAAIRACVEADRIQAAVRLLVCYQFLTGDWPGETCAAAAGAAQAAHEREQQHRRRHLRNVVREQVGADRGEGQVLPRPPGSEQVFDRHDRCHRHGNRSGRRN
jgi:hypothetical protein